MEAPDLLANAAIRSPARACVVEGGRRHSFAVTDERASRAAAAMGDAGLVAGDRVAILADNQLEYLEVMVAAQRAGVVLVPLNYRLTDAELAYIVGDCRPRLLIHGPGQSAAARALAPERTWHLGDAGAGERYEAVIAAATPTSRPVIDAAAPSAIMYTSGTTGRPKGAVLANGAIATRAVLIAMEAALQPGDVFVQTLPMFHIAANISCAVALRGGTNVMVRSFDTRSVLGTLEEVRASLVLLVPTTINLLCEDDVVHRTDLSSLRTVLYGASPIPPKVLRRAIATLGCGFLQFFGMTETGGCSLLRPEDHDPDRYPERLASAGTESVTFAVRVVDALDRELPRAEVGEVVCRGPAVMDGYWSNPAATAEAMRGGWMHTGDLGYRAADGYLHITDRLKDMIVTGGENVYPREVEDVLYDHPAVLEATVLGIPDDRWGEAVHALVVARGSAPDPQELITHCRSRLAGYKAPKSLEFVDTLPRNATGKVLKRELRERFWANRPRRVS